MGSYLKIQKPSLLHSLILHEAARMKKQKPNGFKFINFLDLWDLGNLREEDWQQHQTSDGSLLPSLVEKIIGCYAKELSALKIEASAEISDLTDKAITYSGAYPARD